MPRVLLQPRGTRRIRGQENFEKSIQHGLQTTHLLLHLDPADASALATIYGDEPARLWGSTPTDQAGNDKAMALRDRSVGDVVLFYAEKSFIARATIAHLMHNRPLAEAIWGRDEAGQTWEHMMALVDVEHRRVASATLLGPLGVHPVVRGLTLLSQADSDRVLAAWDTGAATPPPVTPPIVRPAPPEPQSLGEALDLMRPLIGLVLSTVTGRPNRILGIEGTQVRVATERSPDGEPVDATEVQRALERLRARGSVHVHPDELGYRSAFIGAVLATVPGATVTRQPARITLETAVSDKDGKNPYFAVLDGAALVRVRKEQGLLRRLLIGDETAAECALCGLRYPTGFLVAAHIKRRSACTDEERNDLENVAMLNCVFGCDALFENGYVAVNESGFIEATNIDGLGDAVAGRMQVLAGRPCLAHTVESSDYFAWHRESVYRASVST